MQKKSLSFGRGFRVAIKNRRAEAAVMVIAPGDAEGDTNNRHRGADQWLYVVEGTGTARVRWVTSNPPGTTVRRGGKRLRVA